MQNIVGTLTTEERKLFVTDPGQAWEKIFNRLALNPFDTYFVRLDSWEILV